MIEFFKNCTTLNELMISIIEIIIFRNLYEILNLLSCFLLNFLLQLLKVWD